ILPPASVCASATWIVPAPSKAKPLGADGPPKEAHCREYPYVELDGPALSTGTKGPSLWMGDGTIESMSTINSRNLCCFSLFPDSVCRNKIDPVSQSTTHHFTLTDTHQS